MREITTSFNMANRKAKKKVATIPIILTSVVVLARLVYTMFLSFFSFFFEHIMRMVIVEGMYGTPRLRMQRGSLMMPELLSLFPSSFLGSIKRVNFFKYLKNSYIEIPKHLFRSQGFFSLIVIVDNFRHTPWGFGFYCLASMNCFLRWKKEVTLKLCSLNDFLGKLLRLIAGEKIVSFSLRNILSFLRKV